MVVPVDANPEALLLFPSSEGEVPDPVATAATPLPFSNMVEDELHLIRTRSQPRHTRTQSQGSLSGDDNTLS